MRQKDLFGEEVYSKTKAQVKSKDYDSFVEKFERKKTTDDCYTPEDIYSEVLSYVREHYVYSNVVRPFYPDMDYKRVCYGDSDVVIDNPPFSILSEIVRYYVSQKVKFFLFAPALTLFSAAHKEKSVTKIVCGVNIVYENGAKVPTSFLTNMWGDGAIIVDGNLYKRLDAYNKNKRSVNSLKYPISIVSAALLQRISTAGGSLVIPASEMLPISKLDNYGAGVFGGGYIISSRAAAERAAAERLHTIELSEREVYYIKTLDAQ